MLFKINQNKAEIQELKQKVDEQQDLIRSLANNVATISFAPDGTIISANDLFLRAVGYSLHEIEGRHHKMFCFAEDANSAEYQSFWRDLANGVSQKGTFKRQVKSGETMWLEATYIPVKNDLGQVTSVFKIAYDVTEQKIELDALNSINQALDRSSAVIEFTPDGTIVRANENFLNAVGYSLNEIVGRHHKIFCKEKFYDENPDFWEHLSQGRYESGLFERKNSAGEELWLEATYNPIFDDNGKVVRVIKFASEVTKQVKEKKAITRASELSVSTAEETMQIAKEGADLLADSVSVSSKNLEEVALSNEILQKLNEQSSSIEAIVSTIRSIADQTNLLALNAAIEAARAGDQGRGFAVVADEVRQLASRTSQSTLEIETVVTENKQLCKSATDKMESVMESVETGNHQITKVNEVMNEIRAGAENVSRTASSLLS